MFKQFMLVLLMVGLMFGTAVAADETAFTSVFDQEAECFQTLDYDNMPARSTKVWAAEERGSMSRSGMTAGVNFGRNYMLATGKHWYDGFRDAVILPCCTGGSVEPAYICPEPAVVIVLEAQTFVVYFDFDKDNIKEDQVAVLEAALAYALEGGATSIDLAAFCDFRGDVPYNKDLGARRAASVQEWFEVRGLNIITYDVNNHGKLASLVHALKDGSLFCDACKDDRRVEITVE